MAKESKSRFFADGRAGIVRGERRRVEDEVRAKYATDLARASVLRRLLIRYRIHREVGRRLDEIAPRDALY